MKSTHTVFLYGQHAAAADTGQELGASFVLEIKKIDTIIARQLNEVLKEQRDLLFEIIKDGHTYFPESDGHTIASFNKKDSSGRKHPYAAKAPWYTELGHSIPEAIHIQNSHGGSSIFDSLTAIDYPDDHSYTVEFTNFSAASYWKSLIHGSPKMVPRDIPSIIYAQHAPSVVAAVRAKIGNVVSQIGRGSSR